jgi:hypothetical protein
MRNLETRLLWFVLGLAVSAGAMYYLSTQVPKPKATSDWGWYPLPGDARFQAYGRIVDGELMYSAWRPAENPKK